MTRKIVAHEGVKMNNVVIAPGALRMEDEFVPVVWNGNQRAIIGKASKLERDGENVSMEIELSPGMYIDLDDKDDEIAAFVYIQPFEGERNALIVGAPLMSVSSGRIREVSLYDVQGPGFPAGMQPPKP